MQTKKIKYLKTEDIPVIKFTVNCESYYAVIDSGADSSWIEESLKTSDCVVGDVLNGQLKMSTVGSTKSVGVLKSDFLFKLDDIEEPLEDIVYFTKLNLPEVRLLESGKTVKLSGIIGSTFHNKYKTKINFKDETFTINYDLSSK